jgi:hypothetical protein
MTARISRDTGGRQPNLIFQPIAETVWTRQFATLSWPSNPSAILSAMMLTPASFTHAQEFLLQHARPLERARFRFHFQNGPAAEVRSALAAFQNDDGGFGRALEPDLRLPASSAIATTQAFQYLRETGVPARDPLVQAAVRWTQTAFDRALDRWPAVPSEVNNWPHAPWWTWSAPGQPEFTANPGIEFVAHLWRYREAVDPAFLSDITARAEALVARLPARPEMHDLLCVIQLAETPSVPAVLRNQAARYARQAGPAIVSHDPEAWMGYGVKPLLLAPRANSLLSPLLGDSIKANLEFEIRRQTADGAWAPNWNWGGFFPQDWPQAELEWKGVLTLKALLSFRSYGDLAG